nr:hypothetical protein [Candidatus Woesebacteria bacterium]
VEEAQRIIGEMPLEQFIVFQTELQYALKWWSAAFQASQSHILFNEGAHQRSKAYDYHSHGKERIEAIMKSPLYDAVRTRVRKEFDNAQNLSTDWAGWLGLIGKKDMEVINGAISTMIRAELPITGMIGGGVSAEKLANAQEIIKNYGIQGLFVENPSDTGLIATFHQHFGTRSKA